MAELRLRNKKARALRFRKRWILVTIILVFFLTTVIYHTNKPLPTGLSYESAHYKDSNVQFLHNDRYDKNGVPIFKEQIYTAWTQSIKQARRWIIFDMFLFARLHDEGQIFPPLSEDIKNTLLAQMKEYPSLQVVIITDEINTTYGSHPSEIMEQLEHAGATIVYTNLDKLRDSNPLYSGMWRMFVKWFGESGKGWIDNPLSDMEPKVTARSMLKLFNVKANHRKVLLTEKTGVITSANAHDASFYNNNIGFRFEGEILTELLESEKAVIRMSGGPELNLQPDPSPTIPQGNELTSVGFLTEGKIGKRAEEALDKAGAGDRIWLGMFYLADRDIVKGILGAAERGADVRLIMDPNKNAFGQQKMGLPNIPVAAELHEKSEGMIQIRWYKMRDDDQYHSKLMHIVNSEESILVGGSANFTRRNLDDLTLETDLMVIAPASTTVMKESEEYFERLWSNQDGEATVPYETYAEKLPIMKTAIYTVQKFLGFTTY